jgi:diguanylate cyclase (GGDEF)-like protein
MGVAHRFLSVRRERDSALTEARMHEKLSERDPLTGLLNRRAIDARFEDLYAAGYDTFALIDLDHFKKVNDTAGHSVGDTVLEVTANVLKNGDNTLAVRMGGEEFILLIKGEDSIDQAEAIRQAIPVRVAQQVPGLERIVTGSMGVVVIEPGTLPAAAFSDIYSLADRLLYEAKEQGRNRSVSETWRGFHQRKEDRRRNAA